MDMLPLIINYEAYGQQWECRT